MRLIYRQITIAAITLSSLCSYAQKEIDKISLLNSTEQVQSLVRTLMTQKYNLRYPARYEVKSYKEITDRFFNSEDCLDLSDSLNLSEAYYKSDFDQNGLTDLLVIGEDDHLQIFIAMNYGGDSLKLFRLTRQFWNCSFPVIQRDTLINYHYLKVFPVFRPTPAMKELVFKYGDFIEYNENSGLYVIERIEYETTHCLGSCPIFTLEIHQNRKAKYQKNPHYQKKEKTKIKKATISEEHYMQIVDLLNYIDFPNLEDDYQINASDNQTCYLSITYNDGKVKKIRDYGLRGTYGLDRLYQLLFDLRSNQEWK